MYESDNRKKKKISVHVLYADTSVAQTAKGKVLREETWNKNVLYFLILINYLLMSDVGRRGKIKERPQRLRSPRAFTLCKVANALY